VVPTNLKIPKVIVSLVGLVTSTTQLQKTAKLVLIQTATPALKLELASAKIVPLDISLMMSIKHVLNVLILTAVFALTKTREVAQYACQASFLILHANHVLVPTVLLVGPIRFAQDARLVTSL
jgi:hypothetical protein